MKRIIVITAAFLYLAFSSGLSLSVHFCGSYFSGIEFFGKAACDCADERMSKECCEDYTAFIKIKSEHNASQVFVPSPPTFKALTTGCFNEYALTSLISFIHFYPKNTDGPPIQHSSQLNILHGIFRL